MDGAIKSNKVVRMQELTETVSLQRSTIYGLIQSGEFPKPFKLTPGGRAAGWLLSDIQDWLASRSKSGGE